LAEDDDIDSLARRLGDVPVDLVIDPVSGIPAAAALRTLRPGGRLVNLGGAAGDGCPVSSAVLRSRSLHIHGYTNNELDPGRRREALLMVVEHAIAGRLTVDHERVPLAEAGDAWRRPGRIVLVP
jgi:NADPH:quinone reductase-like Zn-dependent oxidoreductase